MLIAVKGPPQKIEGSNFFKRSVPYILIFKFENTQIDPFSPQTKWAMKTIDPKNDSEALRE